MRRILAGLFQSMDGVVQAPGGPKEDESGGFAFGGWMVPHADETVGAFMSEIFARDLDLLLGRRTYDIFASYWPHVGDHPIGDKINAARKYVLTSSGEALGWHNVQALAGMDDVRAVKQQDGPDILVQGSSRIYPALLAEGLIDRLYLMTFPIMLGSGKRAFDGAPPGGFRLVDHRVSQSGAMIAVYEPAGAVETGSFALDAEG